MSRQNRVTPFGELVASAARGQFMGNRGILHNNRGELTAKRWTHQQWIICLLDFKGRKRPIMSPGRYTELFFYDEATALAAGHRPCWECNRERYNLFKAAWVNGNPEYGFDQRTSIREIDKILHFERVDRFKKKATWSSSIAELPDGVFVALEDNVDSSYLLKDGRIYPWKPEGYGTFLPVPLNQDVQVLTPRSTVNAIKGGYRISSALQSWT